MTTENELLPGGEGQDARQLARRGESPVRSVAISAVTAVMLGLFAYANAYSWKVPDAWTGAPAWIGVYLFAIAGVFVAGRWWALLPAIAPVAVNFYVHEFTRYEPPWREEGVGLSAGVAFLLFLAVAIDAAILSVGLLLRAVFEARRSRQADLSR